MTGYIGQRAKRKKRNFIFFFFLSFLFIIFFYILPKLEVKSLLPSESLLPNEEEISLSNTNSTNIDSSIEQLNLTIFDKKQKINFRNKQIIKLKEKIKKLDLENKKLLLVNKELLEIIFKNKKKINSALNNNGQLDEIKTDLKNTIRENNKLGNEIILLKEEYKKIFDRNFDLINSEEKYKNKIFFLESIIGDQNILIDRLKDSLPHG